MLDKNLMVKVTNRDNGTVGYTIPDLGNLHRTFQSGETKEISMDELRKLSHIIGLIAWYVDSESFNCESFEEVLNLEISKPFKWIADVVKEVRNTELIYVQSIKYSPFIQPVSDDEDNIENILKCDLKDENSFKTLIKDIIFNPEYIIYDKENE